MMEFKKVVFVFLAFSLALAVLCTPAWTQDGSVDYPNEIYDLLCARPAAFLGGIGGTAVLHYCATIYCCFRSVDDSFNLFVR